MEKIKEIYDAVVAYCTAEPFHAIILGGLALFVLIVIAVLIGVSTRNKKAKKKALKAKEAERVSLAQATEATSAATEMTVEEVKTADTTVAATEEKEQSPVIEAEQPETAKTELASAKAEAVEIEPTEEQAEEPIAPAEPVQTEPKKVEPITEEAEKPAEAVKSKTETKKTEETEESKEPKTESKPVAETPAMVADKPASAKEGTMLHDEFKDVDTDLDFYEEDATDVVARYSGKWIICRVVTDDSNDGDEMYFFELHASNGEKLLSSEEYTTYNGAIRGIETHKSNILKGNFRITLSKKGDYIFKLLNGKGMLLCMGEHYATKARCESAIESTKRFARTAFVDENIQDQVVKVPMEDDPPIEAPHDSYNGKWVIDCRVSAEGERVFFFELFANNGERLLSSEEYTTYIGAVNGIQTHKSNIQKGNFRISLTKHGDYIYKLLNGNNQLLCLGEHYKTKRRCQNAVESVKRFAMNSPILTDPELTKS